MNIKEYFEHIDIRVREEYAFAKKARKAGIDPVSDVEIPIATSLAERAVGLISALYPQLSADGKVVSRILELEREHGSLDPAVALSIAEEIAKEKFCRFESHHEAIEAGTRVGISYLTLGVVSSPIEGFVEFKTEKTREGKDYFAPYYSGPIRSAGGTEAGFSLVILDYLRESLGYARYDPTEEEIKRGVHESLMYHERVTNLQYLPSEKEMEFLMRHVPVQISGDPGSKMEVYNYKDLPRVPTNFIRSGFALVLNEGLALKAPKILKRIKKLQEKGFKLSDWGWLEDFVELQAKIKENTSVGSTASATYIQDLVAGRPVFGHPSFSGSLRLRYGRCRNTGYSTLAVHPATMRVTGNFIAIGTQLKIEKPTKGCTVASCTEIDGPIVRFRDGSVKQISDPEEAERRYNEIEKILYLGDLLVPYGDYANRNHHLDKPGYVERYWKAQLGSKGGKGPLRPGFEKAKELSEKFEIPLHPDYIYFWKEIDKEGFFSLIDWIAHGEIREGKIILPYSQSDKERFLRGKSALEILGCEHSVSIENVILDEKDTEALLFNLGIDYRTTDLEREIDKLSRKLKSFVSEEILEIVNGVCKFEIKDKGGTFIGARMGRPEKAKLRKLTGSPHVLFPVSDQGGRLRSVQEAVERGFVRSDFPYFFCDKCKREGVYPKCIFCGALCRREKISREYGESTDFSNRRVDIREYFEDAKKKTGLRNEDIGIVIKGVRGTSNKDHSCENLGKGLLRARYNLNVNKDGTIRYDMSEMPITHFKPKEIGTGIEKLKELGYEKDINGREITNDDQVIELFPQDIILPSTEESLDERADDVFLRVANFVDDELEKLYGAGRHFNFKKKEDMAGFLVGCIAPHICTAVVGRVIGFSKTQALLASPYIHAAMRRDCDGDEAAVLLLMDLLINFSRRFLPAHRGGTQDAPLVLNSRIRAGEVDDMIFDLDVGREIPLELYEAAEKGMNPSRVSMKQIKERLGGKREFTDIWYSYDTKDINLGPGCSSYKSLPSMKDKVEAQMVLCKKIRAVNTSDVARLIIERHFIRDTRGNLRKFSMQNFRCVGCNEIYRRPSLGGKCTKCGGRLIFTIHEGSIVKYMQPALDLAQRFKVSPYLLECLELTESYIHSIFGKEKEKQEVIDKWF